MEPLTRTATDARQEPLLQPVDEERPAKKSERSSSSWWWWLEICGAFIALTGLFMTIAVLATLDNKPIDNWKYNIQPSSLLSTLTTVAKMGVMLVVASCVSQLKWLHFQQANRLSHLEMYDQVSRGNPMGAAQMLWKMGRRLFKLRLDIIATAFALVSLLSLAIDPMIQQILAVHQEDLQLNNVTATIGSSHTYISNASQALVLDYFSNNHSCFRRTDRMLPVANTTETLVLHMALLNQLASASLQPDLSCPSPATRCEFSNITSLGLCGNYTDVTDISSRTCKAYPYPSSTIDEITPPPPSHYIDCTYSVQGVTNYRNLTINFGGDDGATFDWFRSILDIIQLDGISDDILNYKPFDIARMFSFV
ncbi:uncharacterized protein LY89DRAFT_765907 [Mollisia scopiformis]|uniref:Uncharacterized protein n=1 Tax=Mollisia scopiformis TaxID=149040 RepID=A0A132B753_MOLSC|nr:uncharacterized protein LY89DRAFT_765907 [Mollisia scopiformis]KUJ07829.1 hypothetical protein LY89DRAFT_765907 [Mollisia scopiformis]